MHHRRSSLKSPSFRNAELSKPDSFSSHHKKINKGAKILADLFYWFSLTRKAQITLALNLIAKNTADAILADDLLFGSSLGDQIKKAVSMKKSSKDIVKTPLAISKKIQQPIRPLSQVAPVRSGNVCAAVRQPRATTRKTKALSSSRRSSYQIRGGVKL